MRLLRLCCLLGWVLLSSESYLVAQNNEHSVNSLMNQGYPILPPIVRTPIVSLSDQSTYDGNHGQTVDVYWNMRSTQSPSFPTFPVIVVHSTESANEATNTVFSTGMTGTFSFNTGVTGTYSLDPVHDGPKISLAEYAEYWKTHTSRATRVYTNADIDRVNKDR